MTRLIHQLLRDRSGGPAAEFALVAPLLIIFLFGIIDVGRLMWEWNRAEKATQMGARYAVATNLVPAGLATYSYATEAGIPQGDPVPAGTFPVVECTATICTCNPAGCPWDSEPGGNHNPQAFTKIVNRMRAFKPDITNADVRIEYTESGLGFAGDPNGPDVAPLVTIRLRNLEFTPLLVAAFGLTIDLPEFRTSLTMEDGRGEESN